MNKMVKLPIFLGVVGAVCSGILAVVNGFTSKVIDANKKAKAAAAYIEMYKDYGVVASDVGEEIAVSNITGVTSKVVIQKSGLYGVTYTGTAKGYGGNISFQVAFANGKFLSYTDLGNSETDGYGKTVIGSAPTTLKGIDATASTDVLKDSGYASLIAGRSVTGKALASVFNACAADYAADYASHK